MFSRLSSANPAKLSFFKTPAALRCTLFLRLRCATGGSVAVAASCFGSVNPVLIIYFKFHAQYILGKE
jgi:hypothetical protein